MKKTIFNALVVALCLMTVSVMAQNSNTQNDSRRMQVQVASGQKTKVEGMILRRDNNTFTMRDMSGSELTVQLTGNTKVEEKKSNFFRSSKKYSNDQVTRGLYVEVEGRGDASGGLIAEKIKFSKDAQRVALSVTSQVVPAENRVGEA